MLLSFFYTPITEEDFEKSMNFGEIATDIYSDGETEDISIYITFDPDYFAGARYFIFLSGLFLLFHLFFQEYKHHPQ